MCIYCWVEEADRKVHCNANFAPNLNLAHIVYSHFLTLPFLSDLLPFKNVSSIYVYLYDFLELLNFIRDIHSYFLMSLGTGKTQSSLAFSIMLDIHFNGRFINKCEPCK